ncbi:MAG: bacillithiol biosynthesis cysteine-adding enzyme BshC [Gemmatimonadetes bacterium]|nr:bacillithiol biosynthesis cysteine-adding enzyme BshC [Gemmatimonadota bacterium]
MTKLGSLEIHVGRLAAPALVRDYHAGAAALAPFYTGSPWDPEAYQRKAEEVSLRFDAGRRQRMAAAVRPTTPAAARRLERLRSGDGVFVTTGQQAGLFTGPLYTIYKIMSAIRLAGVLERVLDRPVAPLFWVASDDHDWEEASQIEVLSPDLDLRRVALSSAAEVPRSMARIPLDDTIEETVLGLARALPDTEFTPALLERLRAAYRPGQSMAGAFSELVADLFRPFDLLIVDAADPVIKELAADVLTRELEQSAQHELLLAEQTARLQTAGYHAQVTIGAGASNLFYEDAQSGRDRLLREDGAWRLRRSKRTFTEPELRALIEREPGRFSPNVLLRPVVESSVFPTVAYVAGPAELGYYAQVGCLFRAHGIEMPLVFPRASLTLVEGKVRKVLDKFGLEVDDFRRPARELMDAPGDGLPVEITATLAELRRRIEDGYRQLTEGSRAIDATLEKPLAGARNSSLLQLEEAEKKIGQHWKRRNSVALDQLEKARLNLFPGGQPQERVFNVFQYLARYGPALLGALLEAVHIEMGDAVPGWAGVRCG